jgi:hypothetical protein
MIHIVPMGGRSINVSLVHLDDPEPLRFVPPEHFTHQSSANRVGLEQDKGALGHAPGA